MLAGEGGQHEMAKPYSVDLRERVVASVVRGGLTRHQAALQFGVGVSTAIAWVRRFHDTGSVAPGRMGGYRPKKIVGEHRAWLVERIKEKDFTLRKLVVELAERGLKVDYRTVWNFVHAERLSFKKNRARQRTGSHGRRPPTGAVGQVSEPH
jgi:putative transposase